MANIAPKLGFVNEDGRSARIFDDADYTPRPENWYTAKPYGFQFYPKDGSPAVTFFLPINPRNITITTPFATALTTTLYGTVEEHSPVRYYDISIEGSTGMGPRYVEPFISEPVPEKGRSTFSVKQTIESNRAKGFFSKNIGAIQYIDGQLGNGMTVPTGLQMDQTGYMAFHNLYRFLLKYKKDASSGTGNDPNYHPLTFFNYKDNNQYKVAIRTITMRRDKEDPMVYHYSIQMRGYELSDASQPSSNKTDTYDPLISLGLAGVDGSTALGAAKEAAAKGKEILSSIANGIDQLGR